LGLLLAIYEKPGKQGCLPDELMLLGGVVLLANE
jgi:hypothetical protein